MAVIAAVILTITGSPQCLAFWCNAAELSRFHIDA